MGANQNIVTEMQDIRERLSVLRDKAKGDAPSLKKIEQIIDRIGAIETHLALSAGVDA